MSTVLEVDLARAPTHSFLGLQGATPARLRIDVRDLSDSWPDFAAYFATQLPSALSTPNAASAGCSASDAHDLETLLYGVYRRAVATVCGTKRLEVGDSVLAPHNYSFLSSFSTRDGTEFKDTRVFSLYRALATATAGGARRIDKPNYILYAEVTDEGDVWSVGEGMGEVVLGPLRADITHWLDAHAWGKVRDSGREAEVMAALTERQRVRGGRVVFHPDGRIPEGIARDMGLEAYRKDLANATRAFRDRMARTGIAHSLLHLLAANEMCGAVLAWAVIGHKLVRMYVLGPSRIAIEVVPPRRHTSLTTTTNPSSSLPPLERAGIPYAKLETATIFDRLPHSFLAPDDPSIFPPGPRINRGAMQAFANVAAASALRLGALDCTQALRPLPTPRQDRVVEAMVDVLGALTPLPPELCRYIVDLSRGPTLQRVPESPAATTAPVEAWKCELGDECCQVSSSALGLGLGLSVPSRQQPSLTVPQKTEGTQRKRRASEAVEGVERAVARTRTPAASDISSGRASVSPLPAEAEVETESEPTPPRAGIDWDALDTTLDRLAVFVPVTPAEMDALIAAQISDDVALFAPEPLFDSPLAMETDREGKRIEPEEAQHEEEEEEVEEVPVRTLVDEYDSDAESDIVD